jgi:polyphosphate kinase
VNERKVPVATSKSKNRKPIKSAAEINLSDHRWYLNRELTWLEFNRRVLHEAEDERTPLLERLKFIAIVSANLDEFFMKRIGGLKQQVGAGLRELTLDGLTPPKQIDECHSFIRQLESRKYDLLQQVLEQLKEQGIIISSMKDLTARERKSLRNHFAVNIYPLLTPQSIDPAHPFPFISNLSDTRSAWDMQPDGSYVQRVSADSITDSGSHCQLIEHAEKRVQQHQKKMRRKKVKREAAHPAK